MVTGRLPFNPQGATQFLVMQELMRLQRSESFVKPRTHRPDLPEAAQILILNALAFDPGRRPQNARIFADDLAQALIGKIVAADARTTAVIPSPGSARGADDPLATEIYTDESSAPARSTDANAAARTSASNSPRTQTEPVATGRETFAKPKGAKLPIIAGLIIAIAAAAIIAVRILWPSVWPGAKIGGAQSPSPQTTSPSPAPPEAMRMFNYWITVRQNPKNFPGKAPFQVPGEMLFAPGDRIHFSFMSPQIGYLYIFNESPAVTGQASSYNILFPTPTTNQNLSKVSAGAIIRIPAHNDGFILDKEEGSEKIWLIWAVREAPELEPLKKWANAKDAGEIKDPVQIESLRAFLTEHSAAKPQFSRDEKSKQTMVKMTGDILVKLIELEHH
jgi:hypothetical protein